MNVAYTEFSKMTCLRDTLQFQYAVLVMSINLGLTDIKVKFKKTNYVRARRPLKSAVCVHVNDQLTF